MTVEAAPEDIPDTTEHAVQDELQSIASMLCARFPDSRRSDVDRLVTDAYRSLSAKARIRAHLIPLTLNHCRRFLADTPVAATSSDGCWVR